MNNVISRVILAKDKIPLIYKHFLMETYARFCNISDKLLIDNQGIKESTIYEKLHLGLLHTILGSCIKNATILVLLLIGTNMMVSSSDTWSDVMVFEFLMRAKFYGYAALVALFDMLPGVLI